MLQCSTSAPEVPGLIPGNTHTHTQIFEILIEPRAIEEMTEVIQETNKQLQKKKNKPVSTHILQKHLVSKDLWLSVAKYLKQFILHLAHVFYAQMFNSPLQSSCS